MRKLFCISIHALREEGDRYILNHKRARSSISIHALREEGDVAVGLYTLVIEISIHALREEGDPRIRLWRTHSRRFLSTPSARRATDLYAPFGPGEVFLSTPSARRATCIRTGRQTRTAHFYPRPPRGGRQFLPGVRQAAKAFLSTPSARRATLNCLTQPSFTLRFLSTPSARRATKAKGGYQT